MFSVNYCALREAGWRHLLLSVSKNLCGGLSKPLTCPQFDILYQLKLKFLLFMFICKFNEGK